MTKLDTEVDLLAELRAYKRSRTLAIAITSGIIDAIGAGAQPAEIAERVRFASPWVHSILKVMIDLGVVERSGRGVQVTGAGQRALADPALRSFAAYHLEAFESWTELPHRCRDAVGSTNGAIDRPAFVTAYLESMEALTESKLPFLLEQNILEGRVIDVGSGPSTFGRKLARSRRCEVTALDLPPVVAKARELHPATERFQWVAADFRQHEAHCAFDGLFCSHLLEYAPAGDLVSWLRRMGSFLRSEGQATFVVFLRIPEREANEDVNLFELSTGLTGAALGHIPDRFEFEDALLEAGAGGIRFVRIPEGPSYNEYLVTCRWKEQNP